MPQQPVYSLATPPLRYRSFWPARAPWQVARASPRWWLLRGTRAVAEWRLHPWLRDGMTGGIVGILGGWLAAWAALWITG